MPNAAFIPASTPFKPAKGLSNPHLQTLGPALFRDFPVVPRQRERVNLPDGDFVDLDWVAAERPAHEPRVLLLHGLSGSSNSLYMVGLQRALRKQGIASVSMNMRGASGAINRKPRIYHAGASDDVGSVYHIIRQRYPDAPIFVVGFSLGGNMLLKWLGEIATDKSDAPQPNVAAGIAISVPYDLAKAAESVNIGSSKLYRNILLRNLKRLMNHRRNHTDDPDIRAVMEQLGDLERWKRFREFDHNVMAPLHNFDSADHYYHCCSANNFLKAIRVPTLLIHAKDDPLMTPDITPEHDQLSSTTTLELYERGGHVGFISGSVKRPIFWLEHRIPEVIKAHIGGP